MYTEEQKQDKLMEYLISKGYDIKLADRAERLKAAKEKSDTRKAEMLKMRTEDRMTLDMIGFYFGVSRERVRQIISYEPGYVHENLGKKKERISLVCKFCRNNFDTLNEKKLFCDDNCYYYYVQANKLDPEEAARRIRARARKYYYEVYLKKPGAKELTSKRNKEQAKRFAAQLKALRAKREK